MLLIKVGLLIQYSNSFSGRLSLYLATEIDSKLWKCPIFDSFASKSLTKYQKTLRRCSLGYKNLLNFV